MNNQPNSFQHNLLPIYDLIKNNLNLSYSGLENIDKNRNYIFVMNHQSIIDIPIIFSILVPILNHELILFISHKFYDFFFPIMLPLNAIRIKMYSHTEKDKEYNNRQLVKGLNKLVNGSSVLIFPEGIISGGLKGEIIQGKTGAIRLALQSNIPIIPIGIKGSNLTYPFLLKTKNPFILDKDHPIRIKIGKRVTLDKYSKISLEEYSKNNKKILRKLSINLMKTLSKLSGLPYKPKLKKFTS